MSRKTERAVATVNSGRQNASDKSQTKAKAGCRNSIPQEPDYINNALYNFIQFGRENAQTAKDLTKAMGYKHWREVTLEINRLRNKGAVICAAGDKPAGYFRPRDPDEARHFVVTMRSRVREIRLAARSAEKYITSSPHNGQVQLSGEDGGAVSGEW